MINNKTEDRLELIFSTIGILPPQYFPYIFSQI